MQVDGNERRTETANRLHSLAIHLLRQARRDDARTGVSPARLSALSVIGFGGPVTVSQLAAAEEVSAPTISRIVAALESDGLIVRESDDRDARVTRLSATERGMAILHEGRARRTAHVNDLLRDLSAEELEVVDRAIAVLERIVGGPH